jgi:ABC-2 type transport system ATP-binding protein
MTIRATGLVKAFGDNPVLDGLDLDVAPGEVVALLGPNGAGKTTTIGILTTLVAADAGTATVAGFDVATEPEQVRRAISVTGQSASVDPMLTGAENVTMLARLRGVRRVAAEHQSRHLLRAFGLSDAANRRVSTYSGGMRRRLDLALGLITPSPVLILDEPTTGLDARSRAWLWEQVRSAAAAGAAVLVTTQYLEEADQLADRVVVLHNGVAVANDTPADLKASVAAPRLELATASGSLLASHPTTATVQDVLNLLSDAPPEAAVTIRTPTLDDVFLELTTEVSA